MANTKGTALAIRQASISEYVSGQGWTTIDVWESISEDAIRGEANGLIAAGYNRIRVFSPDGIKWRVEASSAGEGGGSGTPTPAHVWDIDAISEGADLANHPTFANISNDQLVKVLDAINKPIPGTAPALTDNNAIVLYMLMLRGVTTFTKDTPVIRHTQTPTPNGSADGVQKVWTSGQIHNVGLIPAKVSATIVLLSNNNPWGTILLTGEANTLPHTWGWLRQFPKITEDVLGQSSMSEEWWLGLWPQHLYPAY